LRANEEMEACSGLLSLRKNVEVKLENGRISQKPDASKFLNHTLLGKLYEDSQENKFVFFLRRFNSYG
jgi:hypothetical protein